MYCLDFYLCLGCKNVKFSSTCHRHKDGRSDGESQPALNVAGAVADSQPLGRLDAAVGTGSELSLINWLFDRIRLIRRRMPIEVFVLKVVDVAAVVVAVVFVVGESLPAGVDVQNFPPVERLQRPKVVFQPFSLTLAVVVTTPVFVDVLVLVAVADFAVLLLDDVDVLVIAVAVVVVVLMPFSRLIDLVLVNVRSHVDASELVELATRQEHRVLIKVNLRRLGTPALSSK